MRDGRGDDLLDCLNESITTPLEASTREDVARLRVTLQRLREVTKGRAAEAKVAESGLAAIRDRIGREVEGAFAEIEDTDFRKLGNDLYKRMENIARRLGEIRVELLDGEVVLLKASNGLKLARGKLAAAACFDEFRRALDDANCYLERDEVLNMKDSERLKSINDEISTLYTKLSSCHRSFLREHARRFSFEREVTYQYLEHSERFRRWIGSR